MWPKISRMPHQPLTRHPAPSLRPAAVPGRLLGPRKVLAGVAILLALLVPGQALAAGCIAVSHGPRTQPQVALTFDDGWGTANCARVVAILTATGTPATFLPNATWVAAAPAFWRSVAAAGFPFANHTAHHRSMPSLTYAAQLAEITSDEATIEKITGVPMVKVFRPPYGAWNATTLAAASAAGYRYLLTWDTSFADTSHRPDGSLWPLASYLRAATAGTNGSVILGHCGSPVDHQVLRAVIASYRARGFTFVTVPALLGMR
jgi:peptidoglycan/xylan/chitin deacetylase (PgdA/CDA1 family)